MKALFRITIDLASILIVSSSALAQLRVMTTPQGAQDGSSWPNACSLQYALAQAAEGEEIWVAQGKYVPSVEFCVDCPTATARHATFLIPSQRRVYGGFRGPDGMYPGETLRNERDEDLYETILSGDLAGDDEFGEFGDNAFHVVTAVNVQTGTKLSGFTITGGYATDLNTDDVYERSGAGLLVVGTIINEVPQQSSLHVTRCRFNDNYAHFSGAGAAVIWPDIPNDPEDAFPARFVNCTFRTNVTNYNPPAPAISTGDGGGAALHSVAFEFTNCVFDGNSALLAGGGIFADDPLCTADSRGAITHCTFFANKALGGTAVTVHDCFTDPGSPLIELNNSICWMDLGPDNLNN